MVIMGTLLGCENIPSHDPYRNYKSIEKAFLSKLMLAKDSTVIQLEKGHFIFKLCLFLHFLAYRKSRKQYKQSD